MKLIPLFFLSLFAVQGASAQVEVHVEFGVPTRPYQPYTPAYVPPPAPVQQSNWLAGDSFVNFEGTNYQFYRDTSYDGDNCDNLIMVASNPYDASQRSTQNLGGCLTGNPIAIVYNNDIYIFANQYGQVRYLALFANANATPVWQDYLGMGYNLDSVAYDPTYNQLHVECYDGSNQMWRRTFGSDQGWFRLNWQHDVYVNQYRGYAYAYHGCGPGQHWDFNFGYCVSNWQTPRRAVFTGPSWYHREFRPNYNPNPWQNNRPDFDRRFDDRRGGGWSGGGGVDRRNDQRGGSGFNNNPPPGRGERTSPPPGFGGGGFGGGRPRRP